MKVLSSQYQHAQYKIHIRELPGPQYVTLYVPSVQAFYDSICGKSDGVLLPYVVATKVDVMAERKELKVQ